MPQEQNRETPQWVHPVVRSLVVLAFAGVVVYKVAITPLNLTLDFPSLLSLLLAIFSVGLAALFYFKATETSNTFCDNTYKFTRDTAELLARIESGFGERLRHLDESYARIQERVLPAPSKEEITKAEENIAQERQALAATVRERDELVEDLLRKSRLDEKAKDEFRAQLAERDGQLRSAQEQLASLVAQVGELRSAPEGATRRERRTAAVAEYVRTHVLEMLDPDYVAKAPPTSINRRWTAIRGSLPPAFVADLTSLGLADDEGSLTRAGIQLFKNVASGKHRESPN